jgi:hypothetical protein
LVSGGDVAGEQPQQDGDRARYREAVLRTHQVMPFPVGVRRVQVATPCGQQHGLTRSGSPQGMAGRGAVTLDFAH